MTAQVLTLESAKAYVRAYHSAQGASADVEGCGFTAQGDCPLVRLNVVVTEPDGSRSAVCWDVWAEPLKGGALYGEF